MGTLTARPNSTDVASGDITVVGSADMATACASALNDGSYAQATSAIFNLGFDEPSVPAGARPVKMRLRANHQASVSGAIGGLSMSGYGMSTIYPSLFTTLTTVGDVPVTAFPSALFLSGQMQTYAGGGHVFIHELYIDLIYADQPAVTVTAPTGTLDETNDPLVEWTADLDTDGGAQTHYEIKVFDDAAYLAGGFDPDTSTPDTESGIVASNATSWRRAEDALANDTYRAYVRVAQTVNGEQFWSEWDFEGFVVDVPSPGVPTIDVSAQDATGRIAIDLDDTAGDTSTDLMQVQRSLDGGTTWENIRGTRDAP